MGLDLYERITEKRLKNNVEVEILDFWRNLEKIRIFNVNHAKKLNYLPTIF